MWLPGLPELTPALSEQVTLSRQTRGGSARKWILSLPGVLLNAVYRRRSGGPVVHDDRLASIGGIRGPVLHGLVGVSVRPHRVDKVVVSPVDHGAALAGCSLETAHT